MNFSAHWLLAVILWSAICQGVLGNYLDRNQMPSFRELIHHSHHASPPSLTTKISSDRDLVETSDDSVAKSEAGSPVMMEPMAGNTLATIMSNAHHSVVQILTTSTNFNWNRPWETVADSQSAGSGFFVEIGGKGFILTNGHVIEQAVGIEVTLPAFGKELFRASIYAVCHTKDIALLILQEEDKQKMIRFIRDGGSDIKPLTLADSDTFYQGSVAVAVGYPLGHPNLKASTGILSGSEHVDNRFYLQITSPINPGNSGGPLLDSSGNVVGINTAAIESASNVGYSIPSSHFKHLIESFVDGSDSPRFLETENSSNAALWAEKIVSTTTSDSDSLQTTSTKQREVVKQFPVLGVELTPVTEQLTSYLKYDGPGGVYVAKVQPIGLFKDAGVEQGDLLLSFDGHLFDHFGESLNAQNDERLNVYDLAERTAIGSSISIKVWRNGKELEKTVPFKFTSSQFYPIHEVSEPMREVSMLILFIRLYLLVFV